MFEGISREISKRNTVRIYKGKFVRISEGIRGWFPGRILVRIAEKISEGTFEDTHGRFSRGILREIPGASSKANSGGNFVGAIHRRCSQNPIYWRLSETNIWKSF